MRFLHKTDDGCLGFAPQIPTPLASAILSHTWGEEEVTFQEIVSGKGLNKSGYKKLSFCAKQAERNGLKYFWVDTCCTNKSDRAGEELSRALRSMYRWYKEAAVCYVYLQDVQWDEQGKWLDSFSKSRWFTRGWTLQELLAPSTVQFFARAGELLGDRRTLEEQICEATGIPHQALRGDDLSTFSVSERMLWTMKRETKEPEDRAYCLFRIIGIYLPVLYGEGKDMAMKRLEVAIGQFGLQKQISGRTTPFLVPFERNINFVGRKEQLGHIQDKLVRQVKTVRLAVFGLGGVGKTRIAIELVYCSSAIRNGLRETAEQLGLVKAGSAVGGCEQLVFSHLHKDSTGRWLLIFDNADDMLMWTETGKTGNAKPLMDMLPRSKHGSILFTTRDLKTAVKLAKE